MLNLYQLWLDDLYPKAKFRDALTMVEKVGHSKRMQVSRRAWIDESKSYRRREDEDAEMRLGDLQGQASAEDDAIFPIPSESRQEGQQQQSEGGADAPDDDELDALLGEQPAARPQATNPGPPKQQGPFQDDDEDEDELDATLNEDSNSRREPTQKEPAKPKGPFENDEDDQDELDMLLAQEHQHTGNANGPNTRDDNNSKAPQEPDFADDEEAMAEMGW